MLYSAQAHNLGLLFTDAGGSLNNPAKKSCPGTDHPLGAGMPGVD